MGGGNNFLFLIVFSCVILILNTGVVACRVLWLRSGYHKLM